MLIFIHYLVVWVTSNGKYYDLTKRILSYSFFFFAPHTSVGSSKNNRGGAYNNNTVSTPNDSKIQQVILTLKID